jgi:hypothetical protein
MNQRSDERLSTADIAAGGERRTATEEVAPGTEATATTTDEGAVTSDDEARQAAQERAIEKLEQQERARGRIDKPTDESAGTTGDTSAGSTDATGGSDTPTGATDVDERPAPLFSEEDAEGYRGRWREVQAGFVDDPRNAVQAADSMVAELMQKLAEGFADQRATLEQQWDRQGEPSTEELRITLRRYRSFFDRLLSL